MPRFDVWKTKITPALLLFVVLSVALVGARLFTSTSPSFGAVSNAAESSPGAFVQEAYTTIQNNFWRDISNERMNTLFARGIEKTTPQSSMNITSKEQLASLVNTEYTNMNKQKRKKFPARLVNLVLQTLPPKNRSRVYTQNKEEKLSNRVNNVNPKENLYKILDVSENANTQKIASVYKSKKQELSQRKQSTSTKRKQSRIEYAGRILSDKRRRQKYDSSGSEPTVFAQRLTDDVVHLRIYKYNKRTLKEFQKAVTSIDLDSNPPSSMIIDLRSNVGGAVGVLPYLLGPFIGPDRPAYEFIQQGSTTSYRTQTGWMDALVPYKKVVILVDEKTQSTGELMASVLKKYNVGVVVGQITRGWGTIERVFELENQYRADRKYSLFLAHHLTLRGDGTPMQDNGVIPDVRTGKDGWQQQLYNYIPHDPLVRQVENVWNTIPLGTQM